jgi:acyl carrier protein
MKTIDDRIVRVISRAADVPEQDLSPDANLAALGIGSLERIECVLALEDELHIDLAHLDLHALRTMRDVFDVVRKALADVEGRAPGR